MFDLSPAKLLVIAVAALIVLGPEKLPTLARSAGSWWSELRRWRTRLESDVRSSFPDLPPTHRIAAAVRSPLGFLDQLADEHEGLGAVAGEALARSTPLPSVIDTGPGAGSVAGAGGERDVAPLPADPTMN